MSANFLRFNEVHRKTHKTKGHKRISGVVCVDTFLFSSKLFAMGLLRSSSLKGATQPCSCWNVVLWFWIHQVLTMSSQFFSWDIIYIYDIYIIYVYLCLGYPLRYTHHGHQLFATDCFLTTPFAAVVWLSNLPWSSWRVGRRLKLQLAQGVGWWGWIKLFTMGPKSSPTPYVSRFLKLGIYIEKFICWINCVWFNVSHWLRSYNIVAPIHPRRLPRKSLMRSDHGPSQTCATSWWGMPLVILDQEGILNSCKGDGKMFT